MQEYHPSHYLILYLPELFLTEHPLGQMSLYSVITSYSIHYTKLYEKKIVTALYAGFVVFCIINLFSGSVGIVNLKSMKYFKGNLKQHVEELEIKNSKLEDEIVRLSSEHDRLVVASRPLVV